MATPEIYIRNPTDTEARGPFTAQQAADLAEAGQITPETLTYDATTEQWVALSSDVDLMALVFPTKKKYVFKEKEIKTLNKTEESAKPITVSDMLDAAEGRTERRRRQGGWSSNTSEFHDGPPFPRCRAESEPARRGMGDCA